MPANKRPPRPTEPTWQVILEEMRSQNRATIDAVDARAREIKTELTQFREQTNARLEVLEAAVRQNSTDIRHLAVKVERGLDERVTVLERRRG